MPQGHTSARPQLVYLVFGPDTYHQEAQFSIVSALANLRKTPGETLDIQVYSDNAEPYRHLPVTVHLLDAATREAWNQPHGYHFRSKHVVLRQVLAKAPMALHNSVPGATRRNSSMGDWWKKVSVSMSTAIGALASTWRRTTCLLRKW